MIFLDNMKVIEYLDDDIEYQLLIVYLNQFQKFHLLLD